MKIGTIYDITFSTNRADTGGLSSADSTPVVRVTENGVNLAYLPTVSILSTGVYLVTIDTSLANGFEVGKRYSVYVTATVNAIDGAIGIDSFTVDTRSIDDVLPTANYTTPPTANDIAIQVESAILNEGDGQMVIDAMVQAIGNENITASAIASQVRTELTTELGLINTNLDAKVSEAGGGGGATPEEIWTYSDRTITGGGGGGGFSINYQAINSHTTSKVNELKEELDKKIKKIPQVSLQNVEDTLNEIVSQNDIANAKIIDRIDSSETEICSDIVRKTKELKEDNVKTRNLVRQKSEKVVKYAEKQLDRQEKTDKMIEDEANEIEKDLEKIFTQEADMIEKDLEDQYKMEADDIEKEINS